MNERARERVVVTGFGVVAPTAIGTTRFAAALREGRTAFSTLRAEGIRRDVPVALLEVSLSSALKEIASSPEIVHHVERIGRRSARTVQAALVAALEAVIDSGLKDETLRRVGVVVAGQNLNQRTLFENAQKFASAPEHLSPAHAMHHLDTDHVGAISELLAVAFGGRDAEGMTIGGASASGNVAIVQAMRLVRDGYVDSCVVVGAMTDLSPMELGALESLGALAEEACRPFDRDRDGFVYGQSAACLVIESLTHARARGPLALERIKGELLGGSVVLDGRRSTEPSAQGEASAMRKALADANVKPDMLQYVNAHGTASRIGDSTEIEALLEVIPHDHLAHHVWVNSTKGLIGHGLSSAGVTEAVATLIQMGEGFVHPNRNLVNPIHEGAVRFVGASASSPQPIAIAMSNSFGFGGFNSSIILGRRNARVAEGERCA